MFLNSYILVFLMHAILFVYSWAFLHLQFLPMYSPISCTCSFFQCILLFPALAVSFSIFSYFMHLQFLPVYSPVSCTCSFFQCILLFPALAVSFSVFSYFLHLQFLPIDFLIFILAFWIVDLRIFNTCFPLILRLFSH